MVWAYASDQKSAANLREKIKPLDCCCREVVVAPVSLDMDMVL